MGKQVKRVLALVLALLLTFASVWNENLGSVVAWASSDSGSNVVEVGETVELTIEKPNWTAVNELDFSGLTVTVNGVDVIKNSNINDLPQTVDVDEATDYTVSVKADYYSITEAKVNETILSLGKATVKTTKLTVTVNGDETQNVPFDSNATLNLNGETETLDLSSGNTSATVNMAKDYNGATVEGTNYTYKVTANGATLILVPTLKLDMKQAVITIKNGALDDDVSLENITAKVTNESTNQVYAGAYSGNTITFSNIAYMSGAKYSYTISSDTYETIRGTLDKDLKDTVSSVTPAYSISRISGDASIILDEKADYSAVIDNTAWNGKVSWEISGEGATYANLTKNDDDGSATIKADSKLAAGKNEVTFTLKATDLNGQTQSKTITIKRKEVSITIKTDNMTGKTWETPFNISAYVKEGTIPVGTGNVKLYYSTTNSTEADAWTPFSETGAVFDSDSNAFIETGTLPDAKDYYIRAEYTDNENCVYYSPTYKVTEETLSVSRLDSGFEASITENETTSVLTGTNASSLAMIYGDEKTIDITGIVDAENNKTNEFAITSKTENGETGKVEVSEYTAGQEEGTGTFKVKALYPGKTTITIKKRQNDQYNEVVRTITVEISHESLNIVEESAVAEEDGKIYDGKSGATIRAKIDKTTLTDEQIAELKKVLTFEDGELYIRNTNKAADANVFVSAQTLMGKLALTEDLALNADSVTYEERKEITEKYVMSNGYYTVSYQVNKRPVYISIGNNTKEYGDSDFANGALQSTKITYIGKGDGKSGYVGNDTAAVQPTLAIDWGTIGETVTDLEGTLHENVIYAVENTGDPGDNYYFVFDTNEQELGDITVMPQSITGDDESGTVDAYDLLELNRNSAHVYRTENTLYSNYDAASGLDNKVVFNVTDDTYGYNAVYQVTDSAAIGTEITENNPLTFSVNDPAETKSLTFRFVKKSGDGTSVLAVSKAFTLKFHLDNEAPEAELTVSDKSVGLNAFVDAITFGLFSKEKTLTGTVTITDNDGGSGEETWSYHVATVDALNGATSLAALKEYALGSECQYTPGTGAFTIGSVDEQENFSQKYIVFIKTQDAVGNTKIFVSNGLVIDQVIPESITITNKVEADDTKTYLQDDADMVITATDDVVNDAEGNPIFAGIAGVTYTVKQDGTVIKKETKMDTVPDSITQEELTEKYLTRTYDVTDLETEEASSDRYEISVTAKDFAGNETSQTRTWYVDKLDPEIIGSVSGSAQNEKYYADDVTLKADITERYLSENTIVYTVNVNGVSYTKTIAEWLADTTTCENLGITPVVNLGTKDTDENVSTLSFTFSKDGVYNVGVVATDFSGRTDKWTYSEFVIDKTKPTVTVSYTRFNDQTDITTAVKEKSQNDPYYIGEDYTSVRETITVIEKNFDPANAIYTVTGENVQKDDKTGETLETGIQAAMDAAKTADGWTDLGNDTWQYTADYSVDAAYSFVFEFKDLAGNPLEVSDETAYITLDKTKPEGSVELKKLVNGDSSKIWEEFIEKITFGLFARDSIDAVFTAEDVTSGVAKVEYLAIPYNDATADQATLTKAELLERQDWTEYPDNGFSVTLENAENENVVVYEKITDKAGNIEFFSSSNVMLDIAEPTPVITETSTPAEGKGIYGIADNPAFDVEVIDPDTGGAYSGLENVTYTITNKDTNYSETYTLLDNSDDKASHEQTYTGSVDIKKAITDVDKFDSNNVEVVVQAKDFSLNELTSEVTEFAIDNREPIVKFDFDTSDVKNGRYYNTNKVLTITVTELNFDTTTQPVITATNDGTYIWSGWEKKAAETYVGTVEFTGEDSDYTASYSCKDLAGNQSNVETLELFTVDKVAPVVDITYLRDGKEGFVAGTTESEPAYVNENYRNFQTNIDVVERNFDAEDGNVVYTVSAKNQKGSNVATEAVNNAQENAAKNASWSKDPADTTHREYTVTYSDDANYGFNFQITDLAGNTTVVPGTAYVTLDRTRPTGSVTVSNLVNGTSLRTWTTFVSKTTIDNYGKTFVSGSMEGADETAGVKAIDYLVSNSQMNLATLKQASGWKAYSKGFNMSANADYYIYERVTDRAGNVEYFSSDRIIVDNAKPGPVVTITPSSPSWGKGVYKAGDNPGFDVKVTDFANNNSYSGLQTVTYKIVNGTTGYTEQGTLANYARGSHTQTYTGHVRIDPTKFYSNDVQVTVTASDYSTNNATSATQTLKIDNQAPVVKFSFDTSDAKNGKYYNTNKTLTITVNERNFDTSYKPTVTSSTNGGYSFSGWSVRGETATGTITFSGDADYTVSYYCYDLAGNKSNTETLNNVTIDKTKPTVAVSYDNNDVKNTSYYKASRTATITITEHNFNASGVTVKVTASLNGSSVTVPSVSGWSSNGDRHTATIKYDADADYTFTISVTDLASNVSEAFTTQNFTVDKTDPVIEITGVENKTAYNGTVAPVINMSDINFDSSTVKISLTGVKKGAVDTTGMYTVTNTAQGSTITFANFPSGMDDIYTLTAEVFDKAGNSFTISKTFSVNRDGSTYELADYLTKLISGGYTNAVNDLVITETNVNALSNIRITVSRDGNLVELKEGEAFSIKASGSETAWRQYVYTINASAFEEEGHYVVEIYSEDEAKNKTTNTSQKQTIEFTVDKTSPVISISSLESGGRYQEDAHAFTVNVDDNMCLSKVVIEINGEVYATYEGEELSAFKGAIPVTLEGMSGYQNVKVTAYDAAGNTPTEVTVDRIAVSANRLVLFYLNKPLFYGTLIGILAVLAIIFFIIAKRRKKDDEEEQAKKKA